MLVLTSLKDILSYSMPYNRLILSVYIIAKILITPKILSKVNDLNLL